MGGPPPSGICASFPKLRDEAKAKAEAVSAVGTRKRERRWVIYAGQPEASKVPPEWHGWLHGTQVEPPTEVTPVHYPWMKPHLPNLTGTPLAYRPPGHTLSGGRRAAATGDYQAWSPDSPAPSTRTLEISAAGAMARTMPAQAVP